MLLCLRCGEGLKYDIARGWIHGGQGGALYMYCRSCGWRGAPYPLPVECPRCGFKQLRDEHVAMPDRRIA